MLHRLCDVLHDAVQAGYIASMVEFTSPLAPHMADLAIGADNTEIYLVIVLRDNRALERLQMTNAIVTTYNKTARFFEEELNVQLCEEICRIHAAIQYTRIKRNLQIEFRFFQI